MIPGYPTIRAFAEQFGLAVGTVSRQLKVGYCAWPRRRILGQTKNDAYKCWENMVQRATNPRVAKAYLYAHVDIDPRWQISFEAFIADLGPRPSSRHSIDRIDGSRGYWPDNCRWADGYVQAYNRQSKNGIEHHRHQYRFTFLGYRYTCATLEEAEALKRRLYEEHVA